MSVKVDESQDAIDRTVLDSLRELQEAGDPDIVEEVCSLFLAHTPDKISAIERAAEQKDAKALLVAAHSLKSSSAYVGAMNLSAMSKELEQMGRSGSLEGALERAAELKAEYLRVRAALEAEMQS